MLPLRIRKYNFFNKNEVGFVERKVYTIFLKVFKKDK